MKRYLGMLVCLCLLLPCKALAMEEAYLSGEALKALEPAFEAFVEQLADTLVGQDLLAASDKEDWILYQLGDYLQNGGYGTIAVMYTPGLLGMADESITVRRLQLDTGAGSLTLETLRRYHQYHSSLPGLPLDVDLLDAEGEPVPCRFRWTASYGSFFVWDGTQGQVVDVGATYIWDGRPLYWFAEPVEDISETLELEILKEEEEVKLASASLTVVSGDEYWAPEDLT